MGLGSSPGSALNQLKASDTMLNEAQSPRVFVEGIKEMCEKLGLERRERNQQTGQESKSA